MISATHNNEILTNNSKIEYCKQCKQCVYWNGGDNFSNKYTKANCQKFVRPKRKPIGVINNTAQCPFREQNQ